MERKDRSVVVSIRIPEGLAHRIEMDVEQNGDHASRADWIIAAIRAYEEHRTELLSKRRMAAASEQEKEKQLGSCDPSAPMATDANGFRYEGNTFINDLAVLLY